MIPSRKPSAVLFLLLTAACSRPGPDYSTSLPRSWELGSPRGYSTARVITHFHTPYSWDACDKKGLTDGVPNSECLQNARKAACSNRVDWLFLTDHPGSMAQYSFTELLLHDAATDQLTLSSGQPYVNRIGNCAEADAGPRLLVGFESRLMGMGMTGHLAGDVATREGRYNEETSTLTADLQSQTTAVVAIPHTESRSTSLIQSLNPDALEIYSIHANLDPKIRKADLADAPFSVLPDLLGYLVDPYSTLNPDFVFLSFLKLHDVYFRRWGELNALGMKLAGIAGTDSHENVFNVIAADGERLDSHRRLMRMVSNHVLLTTTDADSVKAALKAGRSWIVFEGLGSPRGMDFSATAGATTGGPGDTVALSGGSAEITVRLPDLHPESPRGSLDPAFRVLLKRMGSSEDTLIAEVSQSTLTATVSTAGSYRAEIHMRPFQLKELLGPYWPQAYVEYPWILTNPIHLTP